MSLSKLTENFCASNSNKNQHLRHNASWGIHFNTLQSASTVNSTDLNVFCPPSGRKSTFSSFFEPLQGGSTERDSRSDVLLKSHLLPHSTLFMTTYLFFIAVVLNVMFNFSYKT